MSDEKMVSFYVADAACRVIATVVILTVVALFMLR
jgi:hypothetical protein